MRLTTIIFIIILIMTPFEIMAESSEPLALKWDDLIPESHRPSAILERYGRKFLDLSDPEDKKIYDEIQTVQAEAPIDTSLNETNIAIEGYVVPLEGDGEALTEFLLVPDYGYCIHIPPPPRNQMVYVIAPRGGTPLRLFDTIRVVGRLQTAGKDSKFGKTGYSVQAKRIERL